MTKRMCALPAVQFAVGLTAVFAWQSLFAQTRYTVTEVLTQGLQGTDFRGISLSTTGGVVGYYLFTGTSNAVDAYKLRGFAVNSDASIVDIPVLGCPIDAPVPSACNTKANGISNLGDIVGETWTAESSAPLAFLRYNGTTQVLLPGLNASTAHAINDDGFIVGTFQPPANSGRAYVHHVDHVGNTAALLDLGAIGGTSNDLSSKANAINSQNNIVGQSDVSTGVAHATRWRFSSLQPTAPISATDMEITDLGVLPGGVSSEAHDVCDNGEIVGVVEMESGEPRGFLWKNEVMSDIGDLCGGGPCPTRALAINDSERIVGQTMINVGEFPQDRAFIIENGQMFDLNGLIDDPNNVLQGTTLWQAADIDNTGRILAIGNQRTFLLTAVTVAPQTDGNVNTPASPSIDPDTTGANPPAAPPSDPINQASESGGGTVTTTLLVALTAVGLFRKRRRETNRLRELRENIVSDIRQDHNG